MKVFGTTGTRKMAGLALVALAGTALPAQQEQHGRKYKEPPPLAHIVVTVEKGFNGKPYANAAVVFHAVRDGRDDGNLEVKTNPDGQAIIDVIEVGSHLTVQVIANGFATYATDFDVDTANKDLLVKLERPHAQVSAYQDNEGKASEVKPGVQEPAKPVAPAANPAAPVKNPAAPQDPSQAAPGTGSPK